MHMRKKLVLGILLFVLLLSLTACKEDKNHKQPAGITLSELSDFGDRSYFEVGMSAGTTTFSKNGAFYFRNDRLLYYSPLGQESTQPVIMCSDLSCRHVPSDEEAGIPVTCEAECPKGAGILAYADGYVYVFSVWESAEEYGFYVSRKPVGGGGWEEVADISGYCFGLPPEVVGYQFVEDGKAYLVVSKIKHIPFMDGYLDFDFFGVMELTLSTGTYRMLFPTLEEPYQNVYYMNRVDDVLIYTYVSAPANLIDEVSKIDQEDPEAFQKVSEMFSRNASQNVLTIQMDTLEQTQLGSYTFLALEGTEQESYFVDVFTGGVVYVEDRTLCYKTLDGNVKKLYDVPEESVIKAIRFTDRLYLQEEHRPADGDVSLVQSFLLSADGTFTALEEKELPIRMYMALENGYAFVTFPDSVQWGDTPCLVKEEDIFNKQGSLDVIYSLTGGI